MARHFRPPAASPNSRPASTRPKPPLPPKPMCWSSGAAATALPDRVLGSMHGAASLPDDPAGPHRLRRLARPRFGLGPGRVPARPPPGRHPLQHRHQEPVATNCWRPTAAPRAASPRCASGRWPANAARSPTLAHEAHRLGKQVERLSAVLDAAPLPVWLRGSEGKLLWVNQCYAAAVDAGDPDLVVAQGTETRRPRRHGPHRGQHRHRLPRPHPRRGRGRDARARRVRGSGLRRHAPASPST